MNMTIGGKYKWKHQSEVLTYLGVGTGGSRGWHQFEKVDEPGKVWCEVLPADLDKFEPAIAKATNQGATHG